jgi:hypothetical protein
MRWPRLHHYGSKVVVVVVVVLFKDDAHICRQIDKNRYCYMKPLTIHLTFELGVTPTSTVQGRRKLMRSRHHRPRRLLNRTLHRRRKQHKRAVLCKRNRLLI